jgi:hypothetical protein
MYRIERITDYLLNGQRDICIILETPDLREATDKMHELALVPHFGKYQIIEEVYVTNEYAQDKKSTEVNRVEHNETEQETSSSLPLGPQNRSSES